MKTVTVLPANTTYDGEFAITPQIQYKDNPACVLDVIAPMRLERLGGIAPLVVFVQGSGWTTPNRHYALGRLEKLANLGFVVATVGHRDSLHGQQPFPAYLQDVKSAIRYLRLHAKEFYIDPRHVGIWGTSSGGNTALLVSMTNDDARYNDGTNPGAEDAVDYCVACFAPSDIYGVLSSGRAKFSEDIISCENEAIGASSTSTWEDLDEVQRQRAYDMSPYQIASEDKKYPPILIAHGDSDDLVSFSESVQLHELLQSQNYESEFIRVSGGEHEGNMWSSELTDTINAFIIRNTVI